jgi:citrate synthase
MKPTSRCATRGGTRAVVMEKQVERLARASRATGLLLFARAVEHAAMGVLRTRSPPQPLHANVAFYTAVLLDILGLPASRFTPTYAVGRGAGWKAHIQGQRRTGRLLRPASRSVGECPKNPPPEPLSRASGNVRPACHSLHISTPPGGNKWTDSRRHLRSL